MPTKKTSLPDNKTAEEILSPQPLLFSAAGQEFEIYPLPDSAFMQVSDSLTEVVAPLMALPRPAINPDTGEQEAVDPIDYLPFVPVLTRALLPNATKIVAAGLRKPPDWVDTHLRMAQKLDALRMILIAEDVPAILANFHKLVAVMPVNPPPKTSSLTATPEAAFTNS